MDILISIPDIEYKILKQVGNILPYKRHDFAKAIIDGTPISKGCWISSKDYEGYSVWQCSLCKSKFDDTTKFCPNCGAEMKVSESEE